MTIREVEKFCPVSKTAMPDNNVNESNDQDQITLKFATKQAICCLKRW